MPFIWQAVFILLPVTLLAVVSLISLRREAQRAEDDAHDRAMQDVQSLAWAVRASANGQLQRFLALQNEWTQGVRSAGQPTITGDFPDKRLRDSIEKWEQDFPDLNFANLAVPQGEILVDGRQIQPPEMQAAPAPPEWYTGLSQKQKMLWRQLRQAIDANESGALVQKASEAFVNSNPGPAAQQAAIWMQEPATDVAGSSGAFPTETGLSFEEIACYKLLSAKNAKLTGALLQSVWWQVIDHPSFTSSRLLELAEGLTNHDDSALGQNVFWTLQFWNAQAKERSWLFSLRDFQASTNWTRQTSWAGWLNKSDPGALALFEPCTFRDQADHPEIRPVTGSGYQIWFVPREVVKAIFQHALEENKVFIPDYEMASVTVAGQPITSRPDPNAAGKSSFADSPNWHLLGTASQMAGAVAMPDTIAFSVSLYLTNRDQMLSAERRRFRLFGMLILGAAFSALVGLLASWRAFYRQQELNEMKINFVSSVSHELRAPIASVRLMAENLERGKIPDTLRQNEYFRFIVQECRRLSSLIENVLDFSRIEQGRKQYEFELANLVAVVQTTVKLMEPYAAEKGVRLEIIDAGVSNIELEVDSRAIQQALVNLIDNAIKHSPKGENVMVGIERQNGNTTLCLFVADHGPGIPAEEHEKIFERFYRRGSELRRETQGVGIGLSVVQHIVAAHDGRVRIDSEPGKGSRFTIELPGTKQHE
jgi:signal transduction histidine kinase